MSACKSIKLILAFMAMACFAAPEGLSAQMIGGGGGKKRGGGTGGGGGRLKIRPPDQRGSYFSRITKYTPEEEADGELAGKLSVRPFRKDRKPLKLRVYRREELIINIGSGSFGVDQFSEVLMKGVYCTVNWENEEPKEGKKKSRKRPQLLSISLNPIAVEGKVVEVDGDILIIKVKPSNGTDWPEIAASINPNATSNKRVTNRKKRIRNKKLKLKVLPDVVSMVDATNATISLEDLEPDMPIEAQVIQGRKTGYLVEIKLVDAEASGEDDSDRDGGTRG
ncbi:MAG: hypothetical protein O7B26_07110 [Planctomycetota bacterium]|nr:hypothetical protein [Planctomycetota bacterium]